ncbi:MAG: DUF6115 domain-containing protein [Defluviitaleaceae bacterium]|nr:DUF6115 domain-containing protein [Defluviitaleaceae bacterium]
MTLFQMDFFIFMLILLLVAGGLCVVAAGIKLSRNKTVNLDMFDGSGSADEAISELSDMSKNVFKEFDNKYQELLFLYSLIDEKQKKMDEGTPKIHKIGQARGLEEYAKRVDMVIDDSKKISINPKFANIVQMHKDGQSVEEIARKLDMGKGEVGLILTLGGGQNS